MRDPFQNLESFKRFEIVRPLGRGGMGVVYLARDTELDRLVAIKCVFKNEGDEKLTKRLLSEARLMAQLNHPNIVQLYDVIEDENILGLVIEYVEGVDLSHKRDELLPDTAQCLQWLLQIAEGLSRAHVAGIIHCDLKPDNVLISNEGVAKIADFGIAKARLSETLNDDGLTEMGNVSGSYFSLSPEQATAGEVDYRTDLFSFGILMHMLLTGRHPFGKTNNHLVMVQRIVNDPFKVSAEDKDNQSPELNRLMVSLLQKDPSDRPGSASSVAVCLRNELKRVSGESITQDDLTVEMGAIQPTKTKSKLLVFGLAGIAIAALGFTSYLVIGPKESNATLYIAVTKPLVSSVENLNAEQLRRITTTVEHSLQESILLTENLSLIAKQNQGDYSGDPDQFAKANGADVLVMSSAECSLSQCNIKLEKLVNEGRGNWAVSEQRTWPVLVNSLADMRVAILSELPKLFPEAAEADAEQLSSNLAENDYRAYLEIYQRTGAGTGGSEKDLHALSGLQRQTPGFISIYSLYTEVAKHLYTTSGEARYLQMLENFLGSAPTDLQSTVALKNLRFELLLQRSDTTAAEQLLTEIAEMPIDRVKLNDLKANLAYALNDYEKTMQLDLENSLLMPSTTRYYKLAVSQYLSGDYTSAKISIESALKLSPKHLYSMDLSGAIAFSEGDVDQAVEIYSKLVEVNATSANLSNFGLALALNGDLKSAIDTHSRAKKMNPESPVLALNLADSYDLNGDKALAEASYQRVLSLTVFPTSAQDYSIRAQAQSHLGMHNEAIKTLRLAQDKYPSVAELDYAAAIVHTLAGNVQAAIVEVESAIKTGTGVIWFRFEWFRNLCDQPLFKQITTEDSNSICSN